MTEMDAVGGFPVFGGFGRRIYFKAWEAKIASEDMGAARLISLEQLRVTSTGWQRGLGLPAQQRGAGGPGAEHK